MSGAGDPCRTASRTARPGKDAGARCPSLSDRIRRCLIAAARVRQRAVGSSCVPNTEISPGGTPPWRSVVYAARAASPLPTIAQRMFQPKVHGVRPEQRARGLAPLRDPRLVLVRAQEVVLGLLGEVPRRRSVRLDPGEAR